MQESAKGRGIFYILEEGTEPHWLLLFASFETILQHLSEFRGKFAVAQFQYRFLRDENQVYRLPKIALHSAKSFSSDALDIIAPGRLADFCFDLNAQARKSQLIGQRINDEMPGCCSYPSRKDALEITRFAESVLPRKTFIPFFGHQTLKRCLPFDRLLLNTFRPDRELILSRKPCVRLRFRLFGWYVRFMTLPSSSQK
jgi:hypothetical protein